MAKNLGAVFGANGPGGARAAARMNGNGSEGGGFACHHGPGPQQRSVWFSARRSPSRASSRPTKTCCSMGRVEGTITHSSSVHGGHGRRRDRRHQRPAPSPSRARSTATWKRSNRFRSRRPPTCSAISAAPRVGIVEGARFVGAVKMTHISVTALGEMPMSEQTADRILES